MTGKLYGLLKYCMEDSLTEPFAKIEFQAFVLAVKSIIPFEEKVGCMLDTDRYAEEIDLLKYYANGRDEVTEYRIKYKKPSTSEDNLLEFRLLPIVLSNTYWDVTENEIFKSITLFTFNRRSIINGMMLGSAIHDFNEGYDSDMMASNMRERLIRFSVKDFFRKNYGNELNQNYIIGFEKERVMLLSSDKCATDNRLMKYKAYQYIIGEKSTSDKAIDLDNEVILINYEAYLAKLRKGLISPDKLKSNISEMHDLHKYIKNSAFVHPLLGRCYVTERNENQVTLRTKSGLMRIKE